MPLMLAFRVMYTFDCGNRYAWWNVFQKNIHWDILSLAENFANGITVNVHFNDDILLCQQTLIMFVAVVCTTHFMGNWAGETEDVKWQIQKPQNSTCPWSATIPKVELIILEFSEFHIRSSCLF